MTQNRIAGWVLPALAWAALGLSPARAEVHDRRVLWRVVDTVMEARRAGLRPRVVFDLDDTLFDAGARTLAILRTLPEDPVLGSRFPGLAAKLAALEPDAMAYDLGANLDALGIADPEARQAATGFWQARFFTDTWCAEDPPNENAARYVRTLRAAGAGIVYLTGRDVPNMLRGTEESLRRHGFPLGDGVELILKPDAKDDDTEFKKGVFARLRQAGAVVACFENEPRNLNAMQAAFPEAVMVFLDTRHSPKPDRPAPGIAWVRDYHLGLRGPRW